MRKTLGADIRRERTAGRISQQELAARCGLNPRTVARIEAGEIGMRAETLDRIQKAIGCILTSDPLQQPKLKPKPLCQ